MDRLISEKAVIDRLTRWYSDMLETGEEKEDLIEVIRAIPSAEPKWIPVSERLPESCGMYIVTRKIYDCPDTAPIIMSDESWFDGQNTWHNDNRINHERRYLFDVIAWMPLPKPYEPKERSDKE